MTGFHQSPALKPCPFCGRSACYEQISGQSHDGVEWSAGCNTEDCWGQQTFSKWPTKTLAAESWNCRRVVSKAIEDAARNMDWQQVILNGGPPCFHLEDSKFCGRAWRWAGHGKLHDFVPLDELFALPASGSGVEP